MARCRKNGEHSEYKDWFHIHSFPVDTYQMTEIPETAANLAYDTFAGLRLSCRS